MSAQDLRDAARLINRALLELDVKSAPCCTCNRPTFRHREHAKIYEHLCGMPDKLTAAAERLDKNTDNRPSAGYEDSAAFALLHRGEQ